MEDLKELRRLFELFLSDPNTNKEDLYKMLVPTMIKYSDDNPIMKAAAETLKKGYTTATEVKQYIESHLSISIDLDTIGVYLQSKFRQVSKRVNKKPVKVYIPN